MSQFLTDEERKAPFGFTHDGILFLLNHCDMSGLNYIVLPPEVSDEQHLKAVMAFTLHWNETVYSRLNGFAGFDVPTWTIIHEHCDIEMMYRDHMDGETTDILEIGHNLVDPVSGIVNVNLVDLWMIDIHDERHPFFYLGQEIFRQEYIDNSNVDLADIDCITRVEDAEGIGTDDKLPAYEVTLTYTNGQRKLFLFVMSECGTQVEDIELLEDLPTNMALKELFDDSIKV